MFAEQQRLTAQQAEQQRLAAQQQQQQLHDAALQQQRQEAAQQLRNMQQEAAKQLTEYQKWVEEMKVHYGQLVHDRDMHLKSAQREVDQCRAEAREALGKANAEASAARAAQADAERIQGDHQALRARSEREMEKLIASRDDAVRSTALRLEARNAANMQDMEAKAQRHHDEEMAHLRHEVAVAESQAAKPSATPGEAPPPCPQCPIKQGVIDQLRCDLANSDDTVKKERWAAVEALEGKTHAENQLREAQAAAAADTAKAVGQEQELQRRLARLQARLDY